MIVQIEDLLKRKASKKNIELSFEKDIITYEGDKIVFKSPIKAEGYISSNEKIITVHTKIDTTLELVCARCLEKFIYPISLEAEERFTTEDEVDDEEVIYIEGDTLDITKIVEDNIIMALPIKKLCSESCKGLCQQCGANLNVKPCNCGDNNIDLRLASLKDFFVND